MAVKSRCALLIFAVLATLCVAGCGDQSLPNGGKGLLSPQPMSGKHRLPPNGGMKKDKSDNVTATTGGAG
jgi:hypothetical protein